MLAYDQLNPLPLVDIELSKEVLQEGEQAEDDEKMELSDDWMPIEQQHLTQTNPLADPDAGFDRFFKRWPLLAHHQRNILSQMSVACHR